MSYEEEKQDRKIEQLEAEIERLRAELASANVELLAAGELVTQLKRVREAEIDQAGAAERIYLKAARLKDTRIQELEDALVEVRAEHNYGPQWKWTGAEKLKDDYRQSARKQLQAEGKIGPDAKPHCWQITEERKAALSRAYDVISWIDRVDSDNQKHIDVLRDMLAEATR